MQRKRDDAAGPDFLGGFRYTLAVDPDAPLVDDRLSEGSALRQPNEEQESVDPQ